LLQRIGAHPLTKFAVLLFRKMLILVR